MKEQEMLAETFCGAIKALAEAENALENFKCYLAHHFDAWLKKYASTPEDLTVEVQQFASMFKE